MLINKNTTSNLYGYGEKDEVFESAFPSYFQTQSLPISLSKHADSQLDACFQLESDMKTHDKHVFWI